MEAKILDGKTLSKEIESELTERVSVLKSKLDFVPKLATIIVGEFAPSVTYVRMKRKACERVGLDSIIVEMPEETTTAQLLDKINELNNDKTVCGILLQHPVPKQIDEQKCFNAISTEKDVDGVNTASFGGMSMGLDFYKSATPLGIITLLKRNNVELSGKHAVVVGRSAILGKPVAMLLLNENCTVTTCHSKTNNLPEIIKSADIVVGAVGKPNFIKPEWVKDGVVLIDAGYNPGNIGDIDPECHKKASAYTPVPGGVGPMTIVSLMSQTVKSAELIAEKQFLNDFKKKRQISKEREK